MRKVFLYSLLLISIGRLNAQVIQVDTFPVINTMMPQVDTVLLVDNIRHMQDYGTRYCLGPEALLAQQWIKDQYDSYGLMTVFQDFTMWGGQNPSDNVIATLPGALNPDEYVVIGGHYDSYASGLKAPGADDNASGTCGVMEVARILSQYDFERTIIFCAFAAEEMGLVGSEAYASMAQAQGMDIRGYFNMDMIGYRHENDPLHFSLTEAANSAPLSQFFIDICGIFLPGITVEYPSTVPGGSDHISFGAHGFYGIFPFEDDMYFSPYIHTEADTIGTSFNSALLASKFIQANLASVVTLARPMGTSGIGLTAVTSPATIFPNPADDEVTIRIEQGETADYQVIDAAGRTVFQGRFSGSLIADLRNINPGLYYVVLTSGSRAEKRKLVIR